MTTAAMSTEIPTREEILARAEKLVPLLREHAAEADAQRRPVDVVIDAIEDAGLFLLPVPRRKGGWEAPFRVWLEVAAILGRGCASTAWVFIQTCQGNSFVFSLSDEAQNEMVDPNGLIRAAGAGQPTGTSRRVDGGWVISGEWPYASGIVHATWGLMGIQLPDESGESSDWGMAFAPMGEGPDSVTWKDTWHVGGLKGTGSNTIVAYEVFIPERRVIRMSNLARGVYASTHDDEVMFRSPLMTLGAMVCVAPVFGTVRTALEFVTEAAPQRRMAYTNYPNQAAVPSVRIALGSATAKLAMAELTLFAIADELWDALVARRPFDTVAISRFRVVATECVQVALDAMQELMHAHGSSSFADANEMQRWFRDVEQASLHGTLIRGNARDIAGRALLGVS